MMLLVLCAGLVEPLDVDLSELGTVTIAFVSYSSHPDMVGFSDSANVRIDAVWLASRDAHVRPTSSCRRTSAKVVVPGPFTAELVRGAFRSDEAKLTTKSYCAFELPLRRSSGRNAGAPSELRGASIVIRGRRADGVSFVLRSRLDSELLLRANELEGFTIARGTTWIVGVDVNRWMTGVDLSSAEISSDGSERKVRIDESANSELLAVFNANVAAGVGLFNDRNGDRVLDSSEKKRPIASHR
jgi:hypothetical protein